MRLFSYHTTVTVSDEQLATVSAALPSFLMAQAALPPRPILHIRGIVLGATKLHPKINMMRYFVCKKDEQAWNYVKTVARNEFAYRRGDSVSVEPHCDTLSEWAQRFVESSTGNKS